MKTYFALFIFLDFRIVCAQSFKFSLIFTNWHVKRNYFLNLLLSSTKSKTKNTKCHLGLRTIQRHKNWVGGGGARAPPPEFGISVNPIQTGGVDYAPHITASSPGF